MNDRERAVLGAVARGEIVRDVYDRDRRWVGTNAELLDRDDVTILCGLIEAGLVAEPVYRALTLLVREGRVLSRRAVEPWPRRRVYRLGSR